MVKAGAPECMGTRGDRFPPSFGRYANPILPIMGVDYAHKVLKAAGVTVRFIGIEEQLL